MANNTYNRFTNTNFKEDYSMEIRFVNTQQTNCFGMMLPGGGFHGGEQTDVLPGGGFHGGEQTDVLPGGGFHGGEQTDALPGGSINGRLPMNETYDDSVLHDEVNNEEPPWVKGTFGVDWFFV